MKFYLLALILELFFDVIPETASIHEYPYIEELKEKWEIRCWEKEKNRENVWMFWNLGPRVKESDLEGMNKEQMILFMWEPPTVQKELYEPKTWERFGKIFTWDDDLVDNKQFFKFYYPVLRPRIENVPPFEQKKFCTLIARCLSSKDPRELYSERKKTIRFFEDRRDEFDLYGMYWGKHKFKNWRGAIGDKLAVLKNYKFSICYENTRDIKGYVTEKIFDCLAAGVVPVYWGASNITDYVPANCFIDRRQFKNNKEMYKFLRKVTKERYEEYLKNAADFLQSEQAQFFSEEYFKKTLSLIQGSF